MKPADLLRTAAALPFLLAACGEPPVGPAFDDPPSFAKPPHAGGGEKGAGADLTLQGGINAGAQPVSRSESTDQLGLSAESYTLTMNLASLVSDANIGACLKEPADMPDDVLQILRNRLAGAMHVEGFSTTIVKEAALTGSPDQDNQLALRGDWWLQLGKNNDRIGAGWPTIVFEGDPGSIDDATQVRVFSIRNATGDVRVVERYDGNGDGRIRANDPVAHLTCPLSNMEDGGIELTVAPGS